MTTTTKPSEQPEVKIIVSGPVGSGKSALLGEIEILMKALRVPVRYENEAATRCEKNMTHADWIPLLEMYTPSVVLVEDMPWLRTTTDEELLSAALNVVAWDWSDNDQDCVRDMDKLREIAHRLEGQSNV